MSDDTIGDLTQCRCAVDADTGEYRQCPHQPRILYKIIDYNERGTVLAVRPYCQTKDYWRIYSDTNRLLATTLFAADIPCRTLSSATRWSSSMGACDFCRGGQDSVARSVMPGFYFDASTGSVAANRPFLSGTP